ncbi:MAG: hypothetical protein NT075_05545 [Chloroflexi bacterium]|nr:hypothetical protein [Chloroflexota bacterium]
MLSVPAIYENGKITLLEKIPHLHRARVIVTILEELPSTDTAEHAKQSPAVTWLGSMKHTIVGELGDQPPGQSYEIFSR